MIRRDGKEVQLGSRTFDLLIVLLRSRGRVVTKEEIFRYVWPDTAVEDGNLRVQITFLKRALKSDRGLIKCIQGRGYLFIAESDDGESTTSIQNAITEHSPVPVLQEASVLGPHAPEKVPSHNSDKPVVVIDDDRATREALESLLRSTGLCVEAFPSVKAFIANARTTPPACFVLDVLMPGQSGLDFQAELAKTGISAPVIFISGNADVHMSVRAMKAGAIEFLTKPVRHEELIDAIRLAITMRTSSLHPKTPDLLRRDSQ